MILKKHHIKHITLWQAGSQSQADYCRQNGLNAKTFSRWLRIYHDAGKQPSPSLIPIEIKPAVIPITETLRLRFSSGYTLELPASISPRWVSELLQCLG
jgi:hypothetical protein